VALRAALVVSTTAAVALVLGRQLLGVVLDAAPGAVRSGPARLDTWVCAAAAAAALVTLAWWAATFILAVAAQARLAIRSGRSDPPEGLAAPLVTPRSGALVRRLAAAALGVALGAAPVPADAAVDRPAAGSSTGNVTTSAPASTRSTGSTPSTGATSPTVDRPAGRTAVVVRPGDTLWSLAAARLGGGDRAEPRAVAAAWPRWWQANRAVVGPDPDLIRPGQVLQPPPVTPEDR
jgi:nucleoid-associated protein YgaU